MNVLTQVHEPVISDAELYQLVADAVTRHGDDSRRLGYVHRRLHDYRSSFAIEEVTATFTDGTQLPLILKNLSPDGLLSNAREVRPALNYDPAREVIVYRDLLSQLRLGTAACYAAVADSAAERYWLLLEKVSGSDLARTGDFARWTAAARWLAEAHTSLTNLVQQRGVPHELMQYDGRCFQRWIDEAAQVLREPNSSDGRSAPEREIAWLLDCCRAAARVAAGLPPTVTHGEFYASNILVEEQGDVARLCPLDWETAGVGPALLDVAALIAGGWPEEKKEQLAAAYFSAAASDGVPTDVASQAMGLGCCRLLLAIKWVGWSRRWQPPPEHRYDWLAEALDLARRLNWELQHLE